jgi:hypothetical protein
MALYMIDVWLATESFEKGVNCSNYIEFRMESGGSSCEAEGAEFIHLFHQTLVIAIDFGQWNRIESLAV